MKISDGFAPVGEGAEVGVQVRSMVEGVTLGKDGEIGQRMVTHA